MPRDRKKLKKAIDNRFKQMKFAKKYGNYFPQRKHISNEPQDIKDETEVAEVNTEAAEVNNEEVISVKDTENAVVDKISDENNKISENNTRVLNEKEQSQLEFAKKRLAEINNLRGGMREDVQDRETLKKQYQDIIDSFKSSDEILKDIEEQTKKSRLERERNEELKKQQKEQEEQAKNNRFVENPPNEPANENKEPVFDQIRIPDFYDKWPLRMDSAEVSAEVKAELTAILKSAGVNDKDASTVADRAFFAVHDCLSTLYVEGGARPKTRYAVGKCFSEADVALLNFATNPKLDIVDRFVAAQKITNVMFKNYSPVAFADHKLDYYTEDYVLRDDEMLTSQLNEYHIPQDEVDRLKKDIIATLDGHTVQRKEPPREEPPKEEPPREEPPKEEQLQQNLELNPDPIPPLEEDTNVPENKINDEVVGAPEKEPENTKQNNQVENPQETKPVNTEAGAYVYTEKLETYNKMYRLDIDGNKFASSVIEAWGLMTDGDKQNMAKGQKIISDIFKDTLKKAFDVEKGVAYGEHRLPEYAEIIKSTNELMRSAMYGFTDMYLNAKRAELFEPTAFGGLDSKDMVELTVGQSLWSMDQKSNEAWAIQSKEAKNIAEEWKKHEKPHEKMIAEMKALVEANEENIVSRKEMLDKLTAAEWLLENDEKMMITDPEDPYNSIPNWGNRYWKALIEAREALGIDKHTSMRDMIQADYAASARAVNNRSYNEAQINYYVLDKDVRELADSMDVQKEQFAIQSATVKVTQMPENNELEGEMKENRMRMPVKFLDQRSIMKNEPKNNNWILVQESQKELTIQGQANAK